MIIHDEITSIICTIKSKKFIRKIIRKITFIYIYIFYLFQSDVKFTNFGVPLLKRFEPSHIKTVQSSVAAYK